MGGGPTEREVFAKGRRGWSLQKTGEVVFAKKIKEGGLYKKTKREVVTNKGGLDQEGGLCKKTRRVVFAERPRGGLEEEVLRWS